MMVAKPKDDTDRNATVDRKTLAAAGAAVGIGSAAIAAALLYANRRKPRDG